jgi:hypothetical protein
MPAAGAKLSKKKSQLPWIEPNRPIKNANYTQAEGRNELFE